MNFDISRNNAHYLPYGKHNISENDIESVINVLNSSNLTQGDNVPKFEYLINNYVKSKFSVLVNSATSALHIACLSLGLSKDDYLWTSPITFVASANCALYCGARIDFVDIDKKTGLMSIEKLEKKLLVAKESGHLPKIIIPVHLGGNPCEMERISELSQIYGFRVIEDASHAIGSEYKGNKTGSCEFSDITVFSFHPVKIITSGEGGAATNNNPFLAKKMRELRSHGIVKDPDLFEGENLDPWFYEQQNLGFNYRMSDIHAALGISQLKRLDDFVKRRNRLLEKYKELLNKSSVYFLEKNEDTYSSVHLAIIRLKQHNVEKHRKIFKFLRESKIGVQLHYIPVHLHPFYRKLGFKEGDFPESEAYSKNAISIPLFVGLKENDQIRVVNKLITSLKNS